MLWHTYKLFIEILSNWTVHLIVRSKRKKWEKDSVLNCYTMNICRWPYSCQNAMHKFLVMDKMVKKWTCTGSCSLTWKAAEMPLQDRIDEFLERLRRMGIVDDTKQIRQTPRDRVPELRARGNCPRDPWTNGYLCRSRVRNFSQTKLPDLSWSTWSL